MKTDCTDYDDGIRSAGSDFCEEYIPFSEAEIRMFGSTFGTADPECGSGCLGDADFPGIPEVIPGAGRTGSLRRPARKPGVWGPLGCRPEKVVRAGWYGPRTVSEMAGSALNVFGKEYRG